MLGKGSARRRVQSVGGVIRHARAAKIVCTLCLVLLAVAASPQAWLVAPAQGQQLAVVSKPHFELIDQSGRWFDATRLAEKPSVVYFGFTRCPVICPTTLYEIAGRMRELGGVAEQINFVFVTVDPERDTPAYLAEYLSSFDSRIIGLTGAPDQVAALAGALGAVYSRIASADGDYTMDHSVNAFLIARDWQSVGSMYMGDGAREHVVLQALRDLAATDRRSAAVSSPPLR